MAYYNNYLIPETLDLEGLLSEHPPEFNRYKPYHFCHIIELLYRIPTMFEKQRKDVNGQVYIKLEILSGTVGNNYNDYLQYLITHNVIIRTEHYDNQKKKYYLHGFTFQHRFAVPKQIQVKVDKRIIKEGISIINLGVTKYDYLIKWFRGKELEFDAKTAIREMTYPTINTSLYVTSESILAQRQESYYDYIRQVYSIHVFSQKYYWIKKDKYGRIHTPITSLMKTLRKYLTYKGQKLVGIDISNCQPFLFIHCIKQYYGFQGNKRNWIEQLEKDNPGEYYEDLKKYEELCQQGKLYEYVYEMEMEINEHGLIEFEKIHKEYEAHLKLESWKDNKYSGFEDARDEVKKRVQILLNSSNRAIPRYKPIFEFIFPTVYKILYNLKKDDHRNYTRKLQKLETDLVLRKVCKKFTTKYKDAPIYTIHDNIITTLDFMNSLKTIVLDETEKFIGLKPPIKIDTWD